MSNRESYFSNAELAWAAYSDLWSGMDQGQYVAALQQNGLGMPTAQAQKFAEAWRVVDQYTDSDSGGFPPAR